MSDNEVKMDEDILSDNEVKIIPIFSTILHPRELVVTEKQTKDLMNLTQTIEWNPKDDVDIGPMVSIEAREEVHQQVLKSIEDGVNLIIGGEIPKIVSLDIFLLLVSFLA